MFKKGEFEFVWIFAIIVGGAILFLAIYGAVKFGDSAQYRTNTEIARQLATLTDPMQAGFADGRFGKIEFREETQIRNYCFDDGLGKNEIAVATKPKTGQKDWTLSGGRISLYNKYIFSEEINQADTFYIFSKPFEFPYKINDLIFLTTKDYCFLGAPYEIVNEVISLKMPNIIIDNCTSSAIRVCFGTGTNCDIKVYGACSSDCDSKYDYGTVEKKGQTLRYVGSLIYGAIFSEKQIYECNVQRLISRDREIASILSSKAERMNARDCNVDLSNSIIYWEQMLANVTASEIISLYPASKELNRNNDIKQCNLW
jgi:hypothetical protein